MGLDELDDGQWTVTEEEAGGALAAFVRERTGSAWGAAKKAIRTGKVRVGGRRVVDAGHRLAAGDAVVVEMSAPRRVVGRLDVTVVYEDHDVVVIDKPAGLASVPYKLPEGEESAVEALRRQWRRRGGHQQVRVVHRIDKATSGLMMFARNSRSERALAAQLRRHDMTRSYLCVAHGSVRDQRIESWLVRDRGDGLRGAAAPGTPGAKQSVTHVEAVEDLGGAATLCRVRLETGRTHQIRIHLSEAGHPLVGETVYNRRLSAGATLASERLLLHAAELGFEHPSHGRALRFEAVTPADFEGVVARLRR